MDLDRRKKIALKSYEPYYKESLHCLQVFVLISLLLLIVFIVLYQSIGKIVIFPYLLIESVYLCGDCLLNHRITILSLIERKHLDWDCQNVTIVRICDDYSWSGRMWESVIPQLYPKALSVNRYKIVCETQDKKQLNLRAVMSGKKYQIISNRIYKKLPTNCIVHFGRYSKIIMLYNNSYDWTDKLNHMF